MDSVNDNRNIKNNTDIYTYYDDTCSIPCNAIITDIKNHKNNIIAYMTEPFINLYKVILNEFGI